MGGIEFGFTPHYENDPKYGPVVKELLDKQVGNPLPNQAILYLMNCGLLRVYDPNYPYQHDGFPLNFNHELLGTDSVDLTLGQWYYRRRMRTTDLGPEGKEVNLLPSGYLQDPEDSKKRAHIRLGPGTRPEPPSGYRAGFYHFLGNSEHAQAYFEGPFQGQTREDILNDSEVAEPIKEEIIYSEVPEDARIIILDPGQELLCHTREFVGSENYLSGSLSTRSKFARVGFSTHNDSLHIKMGFRGRITLEVKNWDQEVTGRPVGRADKPIHTRKKIVWEGLPVLSIRFYLSSGFSGVNNSHFGNPDLSWEQIINNWSPEDMLP